jgi:hypothetical protein
MNKKQVGGLLKAPTAHLTPKVSAMPAPTPKPIETTYHSWGVPEAKSDVNNIIQTAHTRKDIYGYLNKDKIYTDSMESWMKLQPEQTLEYMKKADPTRYGVSYGNTANPGGMQYITKDPVPAGNRVTNRATYNEVNLNEPRLTDVPKFKPKAKGLFK